MANGDSDPAAMFTNWASRAASVTTAQIQAQQAIINANLGAAGLLTPANLSNTFNFFTQVFSANNEGLDAVLDQISVDVSAVNKLSIPSLVSFEFNPSISTNGFAFNTSIGDDSGAGGAGGSIPDSEFGIKFKADGTQFTRTVTTPGQSGIALAITGLGDQRYLAFNDSSFDQLRMLPINQTGTFVCGQGPDFRLVEIWISLADGQYKADVNGGSCTIVVSSAGDIYSGVFSGVVVKGDSQVTISEGEFRVDGSAL